MKTRFIKMMTVVAVFLLICVGCKKNNNGSDESSLSNMSIKKMDLTHAKMLALADTPEKDDFEYTPLYIVNEDGVLESVEYTIELEGDDDLVELVKANLQLKIHYIYQIGEDWLWLFDCRHYYPGIEELDEEERNAILNLIAEYDGVHYLVRKTDGAIFRWTLESGRPWNVVNYGLERPTDFYGIVEQYGNDIVDVRNDIDNNQIFYLKDKGNSLQVSTMIPDGIHPHSVYPAYKDGAVGAKIAYNYNNMGYLNYKNFVIFPSSYKIAQVVVPDFNGALYVSEDLLSIDGSLYVMVAKVYDYSSETDFRKVEIDVANETVSVGEPITSVNYEVMLKPNTIGYYNPVFRGKTMSWLQNGLINTFDPQTGQMSYQPLPLYFPNNAMEYTDGVAYVLENQYDPAYYFACDMAVGYAVSHDITWDDISQYSSQIVLGSNSEWEFNYNSLTFTSHCMLLDGHKLNFYFSVVGDDAGRVHVIVEGEGGGAGRVISTLIRLNG